MNGMRALALLVMLWTFEEHGYSESKKPRTQEKLSESALPSYYTGAFTSWDMYGLIFGYQWNPWSELQFEARFIRGNTDEFKDLKWTRHEDSFGIHQRFYNKNDSWCLSLGFIGRDASFKSHGRNTEIPPHSELLIRRHDIAFRLALGTQYQAGSFVYGIDWITIENRFLTLSTSHRETPPLGSDISNELFDFVYYSSLRAGWKF